MEMERKKLRKEMEENLRSQTEAEIKAELETCSELSQLYQILAEPERWEQVIVQRAINREPLLEEWRKLTPAQRKEVITLHLASTFWGEQGQTFTEYIISELNGLGEDYYINYSLLDSRIWQVKKLEDITSEKKEEFEKNISHLVQRLREHQGSTEAVNLTNKVLEKLGLVSPEEEKKGKPSEKIDRISKYAQSILHFVFSYFQQYLNHLKERLAEAQSLLPNPREVPCEQALELAIRMHKEKRGPQNVEEAAAREHFSVNCDKTKACKVLSRLHSVGLGKWLDDETEFKKAERLFKEMKKGQGLSSCLY